MDANYTTFIIICCILFASASKPIGGRLLSKTRNAKTGTPYKCAVDLLSGAIDDPGKSRGHIKVNDFNATYGPKYRGLTVAQIQLDVDHCEIQGQPEWFHLYRRQHEKDRLVEYYNSKESGTVFLAIAIDTGVDENSKVNLEAFGIPASALKYRQAIAAVYVKGGTPNYGVFEHKLRHQGPVTIHTDVLPGKDFTYFSVAHDFTLTDDICYRTSQVSMDTDCAWACEVDYPYCKSFALSPNDHRKNGWTCQLYSNTKEQEKRELKRSPGTKLYQ